MFPAAPKQSLSPISVRSSAKQAVGLEPAPKMLEMARRARHEDIPVEFVEASAETIPLDDCSSDTVVMTWTMCSIPVVRRPLAQPRRAGTRSSRNAGRITGHGRRPASAQHRDLVRRGRLQAVYALRRNGAGRLMGVFGNDRWNPPAENRLALRAFANRVSILRSGVSEAQCWCA